MDKQIPVSLDASVQRRSWCVEWFGSQADFIAGKAKESIALSRFAGLGNLYAIGPLERGRGEVSIFNGVPLISKVENGTVHVDQNFSYCAGFLVCASIESWAHAAILRPSNNDEDFTEQLLVLAASSGIDINAPFPFLIQGRVDQAAFHVLGNQTEDDYRPELHEKAKIHFEIEQELVEIVGFYSRHHRGIFTPRDSDLHMHVRSSDNRLAGHVEYVRWNKPVSLRMPFVAKSARESAADRWTNQS